MVNTSELLGGSHVTPDQPSPKDFDIFIPWAVVQMGGVFNVVITRAVQAHYVSISVKEQKLKAKPKLTTPTEPLLNAELKISDVQSDTSTIEFIRDENTFYIETTYNDANDLVRLKFIKNKKIPRLLFKIIRLAIPYHRTLSSLIINKGLHAEAIHEISKYYPTNLITELCFENCHVPEANYLVFLDYDVLKHFSLSSCYVTDAEVKIIASKLISPLPAANSLSVLNLSSNEITDIGVQYLAEMLRTNRQLSYLNLANNRITDEGAKSIFDILKTFVLTQEEMLARSKKLVSYTQRKTELIRHKLQEVRTSEKKSKRKATFRPPTAKNKPDKEQLDFDTGYYDRAEGIVKEILGEFIDPFSKEDTVTKKSEVYSLGNNTLRYLNLAYNNLTYISVRKLYEVTEYQKVGDRNPNGLVNIRIEGNFLPKHCEEYGRIDSLLLPGLLKVKTSMETRKKAAINFPRN